MKYDIYDDFPFIDTDYIFTVYLDYFLEKVDVNSKKIKKSLTEALMNKISRDNNIKIKSYNFFRIIKLCSKYCIEVKNIEHIEVNRNKNKLDPKYYITDEDIEKINSKNKLKIIEIVVKIFILDDNKYLMKLIKGKNGPDICRIIFDLLYDGLKLDNFVNNNPKDFPLFRKILLSVASSQKQVEYVVNIIPGLINSLNFFKENINFLLKMPSKYFPLDLQPPMDKDDINNVYALVKEIVDKSSEKKYEIINIENLFENLINFSLYNKDLTELCKIHNFVPFIANERKGQVLINNFYDKIHEKGMNLIKKNKLTTDDIFNFILKQDVYYFKPIILKYLDIYQ